MRHRIILADDHEIILDGLRRILEPEFDIVGTCGDGRALLTALESLKPEVAVVDISMPLLNGMDAFRSAKSSHPRTRFIFLTGSPDASLATQAFRLGAAGYVVKQSAAEELVAAIHEVLAGRVYIAPRIANEVLQNFKRTNPPKTYGGGALPPEREVLQLLPEGKILKKIWRSFIFFPEPSKFKKKKFGQNRVIYIAPVCLWGGRIALVAN